MSPAGLKGVAEEVGLELVVVCGDNMGDIFRRNALNLGLHVVQSPEAVADAHDGDVFSFDPESRHLTNETQKRTYDPVPLTSEENDIRRSGGIFAVGRREFRSSVQASPRVNAGTGGAWRPSRSCDRVARWAVFTGSCRAGRCWPRRHRAVRDVQPDYRGRTIYPRQAAVASDLVFIKSTTTSGKRSAGVRAAPEWEAVLRDTG